MTVLLDTDLLDERERADAVHAAYETQSPRRSIVLDPRQVRHRVERVGLGHDVHLLRTAGSALEILRTPRQVRTDATEHIALGLRRRGEGVVSVDGTESDMPVGELNCVDMTRPYRLVHSTANTHDVLIVSNRVVGVSVDVVRAALPALASSPVYDLVRGHLGGLFSTVRALSPELQAVTGQATTALVRALLATAGTSGGGRAALEDALPSRLALYLHAHLTEHDLTVERAAEAHHISVRHFYNLWAVAGHEETPAQWIISRRLERAREQLTVREAPPRSIASIARRSGFSDTSHFSRRFRESFGASPREWREAHQTGS